MIIGAIVAGGTGRRMGTAVPKQFLKLGNRTILLRSVDAFLACEEIDTVIIGVPKEWVTYTKQLLDSVHNQLFRLPDDTRVVPGHGPFTSIGYEKKNNPFV